MFSKYQLPCILAITACAGHAIAGDTSPAYEPYPDAIAHPDELFTQDLATHMFSTLPIDQQTKIANAGGIGSQGFDLSAFSRSPQSDLSHIPAGTTPTEYLAMIMSDEIRDGFNEQQLSIINNIISLLEDGQRLPAMCFAPDADRKFAFLINQIFDYQYIPHEDEDGSRFQQGNRWSRTATDGNGLGQGDPTVLTYSFAPDGSFVPEAGLGSGNSQLFQWLDSVYGDTKTWQTLFHTVFHQWGELIGTTYTWEPNDDGANMDTNTVQSRGILGIRGDVRIFAIRLDGNSGVLAYNFFPNNGDMNFDAFDSFYNNTSSLSRGMRNVIAHEHGHGLGMFHVCPVEQTKLMEPFVSFAFDGPQLDDVLNGIRHYGDVVEPNDTIAQATDLGFMSIGDSIDLENVGVDSTSDDDFFKITATEPSRILFTVTPDADAYDQGPQDAPCNTGDFTDYESIQDLRITVRDSGGNILDTSNASGLGEPETIAFVAPQDTDYYFVVDGDGGINTVQRYRIDVTMINFSFIGPIIEIETPSVLNPGATTPFNVTISPEDDIILPGTENLMTSVNGAEFISSAMLPLGNNSFTATLPAINCNDTLDYFISIEGELSGEVTFPAGGSSDPLAASVGSLFITFNDDFEDDLGWTVSGPVIGTANGQWERGVPAGLGDRGDPNIDADGSGSAYLTGNAEGNTDVDGGQTILTSPPLALADNPDARVFYSRWYDNTGSGNGTNQAEDVFVVEISDNNGSSWVMLETVGPATEESVGGWFESEFLVSDFVNTTNQVRVRFIAEDIDNPSVIEAAIDGFNITGQACEDPPEDCIADFTGDGVLNFFDIALFLEAFGEEDPMVDFVKDGRFNFFDVAFYLSLFAEGCP